MWLRVLPPVLLLAVVYQQIDAAEQCSWYKGIRNKFPSRVHEIKIGSSHTVTGSVNCRQLCCDKMSCNAVVYKRSKKQCYLIACTTEDNKDECSSDNLDKARGYELYVMQDVDDIGALSEEVEPVTEQPRRHKATTLSPSEEAQDPDDDDDTVVTAAPHTAVSNKRLPQTTAANDVKTTKEVNRAECKQAEFQCDNGECIALYDACDGITECEDESDESNCPKNSTLPSVASKPTVPVIDEGAGEVEARNGTEMITTTGVADPSRSMFEIDDRVSVIMLGTGIVLTIISGCIFWCSRRRRGLRRPTGKEADYLINGMYL